MSRSIEKKDLIYVPQLLQSYLNIFADPYVEQELSSESLPVLIRHICKVLDKENRYPHEFFDQRNPFLNDNDFVALL